MRLAAKLVLLFLVGTFLIVVLFSYLTIRLDQQLAVSEHQRHAAELAEALQRTLPVSSGPAATSELRKRLGWTSIQVRESRIRLVAVDAGDETIRPTVPAELIITTREVTTVRMPDESGRDHLYTYVPLQGDSADTSQPERLEISSPDPGYESRFRRSLMTSLIALVGVATLSGLVIVIGGVKMVGQPLNQLIDKVHRVGQGDFGRPITLKTHDELSRLGGAINEMCEQLSRQRRDLETETATRIEAVEQLRHAERLNMVGRMAAGIAHEIGTPLNVVSGRAELIASGMLTPDAVRDSAKTIHAESQRIAVIVRHLLDFARQRTPQRMRQNLNQLLANTTDLMEPLATKHGIQLHLHLPEPPVNAEVDAAQIQQVLTNLMVNAIHSIGESGNIDITLEMQELPPQWESSTEPTEFAVIAVRDDGQGISKQDQARIFEPFYTTKDVGEGTGLGLSISHGIVQEHHGWISVDSEPGAGSTFSIFLPLAAPPHAGPQESEPR